MSTVSSPAALPKHIETLLTQRHSHVAAIATIDATLGRVTAALGGSAPKAVAAKPVKSSVKPPVKALAKSPAKPVTTKSPVVMKSSTAVKAPVGNALVGKPPAPKSLSAKPPVAKPVMAAKPKSGLTASEFVLEFVKAKKNPTSQEINNHWKGSGRLGMADNTLSLLTKIKRLKRTPLGNGVRGSRYTIG